MPTADLVQYKAIIFAITDAVARQIYQFPLGGDVSIVTNFRDIGKQYDSCCQSLAADSQIAIAMLRSYSKHIDIFECS